MASSEVTIIITFDWDEIQASCFKQLAMYWPCSDESTDIKHECFKSGHDLDLTSNF